MTLQLIVNGQDVAPLLTGAPSIGDEIDGVCRTLDFTLQAAEGLVNYLGQSVQLYLGGKRWYYGFLEVRGWESSGQITYKAYDPLYFLKKNPADYYFKNDTATQRAKRIMAHVGVKAGKLANTGAILPPKLYQKVEGDKAIIDGLARTYQANKKKFWLRFDPDDGPAFGGTLFERIVPKEVWAFQRGVNLVSASYEESLEEVYNVVRLVNRDTGKTVVRIDQESVKDYGARTVFEEIDKDKAATMEKDAADMLKKNNKVKTTISLEGINADLAMPQFYSGDVIYVEDDVTRALGAYHIRSVTQTILDANNVQLAFDVQEAPDIPEIQVEDEQKTGSASKGSPKKKTKKQDPKDKKNDTPGRYSPEMQAVIDRYSKK